MRITRDILLKAAKTVVQQRTLRDKHILCAYLTGSVIDDTMLLGGTADIDLIFVHDQPPAQPREILRLTPDVHLDLAHYDQRIYNQPRELRTNPWIGSFLLENPIVLHSTLHWFEFIQASVGATFDQPETVLQRAMPMAEKARQTWLDFQLDPQEPDPQRIWQYLQSVEEAANALAILDGSPLTERRFVLKFAEKAQQLGYPGMAAGLQDLIAPHMPSAETIEKWIGYWKAALNQAGESADVPLRLSPIRFGYYTRAAEALIRDQPAAALWIILHTWTRAIVSVPPTGENLNIWQDCFSQLGLYGNEFHDTMNRFDQFLDQMEEIIEIWADRNGIQLSSLH